MKDRKKSNLLAPSEKTNPSNTYNRNNIFSVDAPKVISNDNRGKRTSVSCFQDTKNKLQSLITIMNKKNVDEVIDVLIDTYTDLLSSEEVNEFKLIKKSLDKRTIKK